MRHCHPTRVLPPPPHHTPTLPRGTLEATSFNLIPLTILSVYTSPTDSTKTINYDLEMIFSLGMLPLYAEILMPTIPSGIDKHGSIIKMSLITQTIVPTTPTRSAFNYASIIDFALTRNLHWLSQVKSIAELIVRTMINFDETTRFAFPKRNVSTNWVLFRELLSSAHYTFHLYQRAHDLTSCRPHHNDFKRSRTLFKRKKKQISTILATRSSR
ncbi:hypothetical protein TNIN_148041 [Trichonephila inaurata madagascariensis]|uniref:Uncharacterized protein n=1 Tax=Trichonephila inaurata madagascariensis TaxID=2747483 RepID=A0A8X6XNS0_9ARAC|nr:hypothetical protein TNIN_148041 [Trichonephila inaurata madagascariensis]